MEKGFKVALYLNDDEYKYLSSNAEKNFMPNTSYIKNRIFNAIEHNPELFQVQEKEKKRLKVVAVSFNKDEMKKIDDLANKLNTNKNSLIRKIIFKDYSNE